MLMVTVVDDIVGVGVVDEVDEYELDVVAGVDDVDVVEESKVVRKAPCCVFCKTQDGDIDPWATPPTDSTGGSSAAGSLRIKLAD